MSHWPENLLAGHFLASTLTPFLIRPEGILAYVVVVILSLIGAFALWVAIIWVACWFHDRNKK